MADSSYSLLSLLNAEYPSLPITIVLKVLKKYDNDEEKCRQALDSEVEKRLNIPDSDSFSASPALKNTNNNNNLESPSEVKPLTPRSKDVKAHENSPQSKPPTSERHVSMIETSISSASRTPEPIKRPFVGQSVSWNVQPPDKPLSLQPSRTTNNSMTTPQSAPPDFSPFFVHSGKDIPNINCTTSGFGSGIGGPAHYGNKGPQVSNPPTSNSPAAEPRHPVKVINIPSGSLSGGLVYRPTTPSSSRHIRMHFGDVGGTCTISSPPSTPQHYGSTPNVSQQYRSELRTDTPTSHHPVHSSSIVVDTSSHLNNSVPERKISASNSGSDLSISGRRTPNPPSSFKTSDLLPSSGPTGAFSSGRLSTPVQATSPGIAHSRPVFVEIKADRMHGAYNDTSYTPGFYQVSNVRPPPTNLGYLPYQSGQFNAQSNLPNFNIQYGQDFPNHASTSLGHSPQEHMYPQNTHQHQLKLSGFNSPPTNLYQPAPTGYSPSSYPHFNSPANVLGYPVMYIPGHNSGLPQGPLQHFPQYGQHAAGHQSGINLPKSPSIGMGQLSIGSRSSSQDSEHSAAADFDPRHYSAMGSRVSSHGSLSSDSSSSRMDTSTRPRSGSIQDDAEYIRALVQHQKSQVQKLLEEMNQHSNILDKLRSEVSMLEKNKIETSNVSRSFPTAEDISRICLSNRRLQTDIQLYMNEIDMYRIGHTPFDKINPRDQQNFFDNMPTGQQDPIYSRTPVDRSPSPRPTPPPRPPPPLPARQRSTDPVSANSVVLSTSDIRLVPPVPSAQPVINSGDSEEGESWNCSACTFSNHPALKKCEMCEMPRGMPSQPPISALGSFIPPPHQPLSSLPPRLAPGLVGNVHHRSPSPHSALGHHHHHTGT